jgi:hypothetical protein
VLVTDLEHELLTIAQLYRDRADAENTFDKLKNQWGWGGFTTQNLARWRLSALAVALIYNWWSLFVRLGNPKARLEAITSRRFLLSAVARRTTHGGAQHLIIASQHAKDDKAKLLLGAIHALLNRFKIAAEQFKTKSVWQLVCEHILTIVAHYKPKIHLYLILQLPRWSLSSDFFRIISDERRFARGITKDVPPSRSRSCCSRQVSSPPGLHEEASEFSGS